MIIANTFHQQPKMYMNRGNSMLGDWLGLADETSTRFPMISPAGQDPGPGPLFCGVWAGDIDNDDDLDLMFSNYNPGGEEQATQDVMLINDGTGVFTNETDARLGNRDNVAFGTGVVFADMNNDGWDDIVKISTLFSVSPWNGLGVFQIMNDQTGNFIASEWQEIPNDAPYMFGVGDFDDNGIKDVFVVGDTQDQLCMGQSINGNGTVNYTFSTLASSSRTTGFGGNIRLIDMDGDGDQDLIVCPVDVDIANCSGPEAGSLAVLRWKRDNI